MILGQLQAPKSTLAKAVLVLYHIMDLQLLVGCMQFKPCAYAVVPQKSRACDVDIHSGEQWRHVSALIWHGVLCRFEHTTALVCRKPVVLLNEWQQMTCFFYIAMSHS